MKPSVLIAGFTTRHVAASAYRAGYQVYAVDHFCDQDLTCCTADHLAFGELAELPAAIAEMTRRHSPDCIVTTSGAELLDLPNRAGTPPTIARRFMDKGETQRFFASLGVAVPKLLPEGVYPAMLKTLSGAGGWRNAVVQNKAEEEEWKAFVEHEPYLRQEFIEGLPASVCCLGTGSAAKAVSANEQILRGGETCNFAFSGSVTPCTHPMADRMIRTAERIVAASGCVGTIGVDFVLTDTEAWAIELNPRFQGTVETVEAATGVNLFALHIAACQGKLPETTPKPVQFAVRKILTAPKDMTLTENLLPLSGIITDIPCPGTQFLAGEVLFSVTGTGNTRTEAFVTLDKHISNAAQRIKE